MSDSYLNNPRIKSAGVVIPFTKQQVDEYLKCKDDPIYFIENYIKIVNVDKGLIPFLLHDYQRDVIKMIHNNRHVIMKMARQVGKTTTLCAYLVHYIIFNDNKVCAILANKEKIAREILSRIKLAYEHLPKWMQQGVVTFNKGDIELENGSKVIASSTSSSAVRGYSINFLVLDEFAFVPQNTAEEFFTSVYPTISSGKTTKIAIVSTPCGMNLFWKIWTEAVNGTNGFVYKNVHWAEVPGRDEKWAKEQKAILGEQKFRQEMEVEFLGSANTLISGVKLASLPFITPIAQTPYLNVYEHPAHKHAYLVTADVSRGKLQDYSAFTVIDITSLPYKIVARYKDNGISTMLYPNVIYRVATEYNKANVLLEINDAGGEVANILMYDLEYENVLLSNKKGVVTTWGNGGEPGLYTSKKTKRIGCEYLKSLVENDQIILNDYDVIFELSNFISNGRGSYVADEGKQDDLTMTLVNFSYITTQPIFKDLNDLNLRERIFQEHMKSLEEDLLGGFFVSDGHEEEMSIVYDF